jgi:hypothetical protein
MEKHATAIKDRASCRACLVEKSSEARTVEQVIEQAPPWSGGESERGKLFAVEANRRTVNHEGSVLE